VPTGISGTLMPVQAMPGQSGLTGAETHSPCGLTETLSKENTPTHTILYPHPKALGV